MTTGRINQVAVGSKSLLSLSLGESLSVKAITALGRRVPSQSLSLSHCGQHRPARLGGELRSNRPLDRSYVSPGTGETSRHEHEASPPSRRVTRTGSGVMTIAIKKRGAAH